MFVLRVEIAEQIGLVADNTNERSLFSVAVNLPLEACNGNVELALSNAIAAIDQLLATRCDFLATARSLQPPPIEAPGLAVDASYANHGGETVFLRILKTQAPTAG
jgi:hypothetical protein